MTTKSHPWPKDRPCPCGSGKRYQNCCAKKQIEWVISPEGQPARRIPLGAELVDMLRMQFAEFRRLHGRDPGPDDPVFEHAPTEEEMIADMRAANIREELIYAFEKTGLIVTEANERHIPEVDLKEWRDAIREFRMRVKRAATQSGPVLVEGPEARAPEPSGPSIKGFINASQTAPPNERLGLTDVFLIHGRDELNVHRLHDMLRNKLKLRCHILANHPGRGRTLIEKFEQVAERTVFAFALLTPDDAVRQGASEYYQMRPNVLFELGWFYGRLGRHRTCILFREGTTIPSDLDGINRIEFQGDVRDRYLQIATELHAAGVTGDPKAADPAQ